MFEGEPFYENDRAWAYIDMPKVPARQQKICEVENSTYKLRCGINLEGDLILRSEGEKRLDTHSILVPFCPICGEEAEEHS